MEKNTFLLPEAADYDQETVRLAFRLHKDLLTSKTYQMLDPSMGCTAEFEAYAVITFPNGHRASVLRIHTCHTRAMRPEAKDTLFFEVYKSTDAEPQKWLDFRDVQAQLTCLARQPPRKPPK